MPKILVVDDDETTLFIFRTFLAKAGHDVETACDGMEGLEKAAAFKPDLILLDINMPRMSGFDVAKKLKESETTKNIPIFIMTSLKQEANIKRGYELGIEEYFTKPTNIEHLKLRIDKFLGNK